MKKILTLALSGLLLFSACSSGVSQAEYDTVIAERDALQDQLSSMKIDLANAQESISQSADSNSVMQQNESNILTSLDATAIMVMLSDAELPIDTASSVTYDQNTDENGLLGRPNQYTSKVNFADTRYPDDPTGCTIEVFNNEDDCIKRANYLEAVTSSTSVFGQYIYRRGNVLFRLDYDIPPLDAKQYEEAFYSLDLS